MKHHRLLRDLSLSVLVAFWLAPAAIADPTNMCVPAVGGLGGVPTIDGRVNDDPGALNTDPGWNGATRVNLGEIHGTTPTAVTELGTNGGFLYVAFVVSSPLVSSDNTIVLGISPDGTSTHAWRVHMRPFPNGVDSTSATDFTNQPPKEVKYWRDSATWNSGVGPTTAAAGTWPIDNTRVQKVGSQWSVEMKIPIVTAAAAGGDTGIFFPSTSPDTFHMYVDVLNTLSNPDPVTLQTPWPVNQSICSGPNPCGVDTFLTHNTPPISNWGTVSLYPRTICAGVTLAFSDIGVLDPAVPLNPPIITNIKRAPGPFGVANVNLCAGLSGTGGPTNTFIARPLNNGPNPAPIDVTFRTANWGIPGVAQFDPLPSPGVATPATHTVSPGAGAADRDITTTWALTFVQSCKVSFFPHQCIHVDLSSPDLSVTFERKSVERNMDFVSASDFRRKAYISGDQGPLRSGTTKHRLLLALDMDQQGLETTTGGGGTDGRGDDSPAINDHTIFSSHGGRTYRRFLRADIGSLVTPDANTSFASWIARGLLYTSGHVRIDDKDFVILNDAGDFGYIAKHDEPVTKWSFGFRGAHLQRINDRLYLIDVAPGEQAEVETVIRANEGAGGGWRFFLDIGPNFPHGDFSDAVEGKLSVNAGLERFLAPNTSIEAILGYHSFDSDFVSNPKIWQLSVNGKQYFGPGPLHFFINGGIGAYRFDPGSTTKAGANAGLGVLYDFSSVWGLEGVYNFHSINTSGSQTEFSTVQVGIRRTLF